MKKLFLWFLILFATFGASIFVFKSFDGKREFTEDKPKKAILRAALVADSEGSNSLLQKALAQAQGAGVNFVIGLGDWSKVGTEEELAAAKRIFDSSKIPYYLVPGDHDLWDSRNQSQESRVPPEWWAGEGLGTTGSGENAGALANFNKVFGKASHEFDIKGICFVLVDNSDIYKGISDEGWKILNDSLGNKASKITFVFAHKAPFHPDSSHVMGEGSQEVAKQANRLIKLIEEKSVDGFFSGDLHFFAKYNSPGGSVKITTVGAIDDERNFQGPRFGLLTVYDDYTWNVEDVEIR